MENHGEVYEVTCESAAFEAIKGALQEKEIATESAEVSMVPQNSIEITDADTAGKILNLIEDFEDHDDVQNVYANYDIPDEIAKQME